MFSSSHIPAELSANLHSEGVSVRLIVERLSLARGDRVLVQDLSFEAAAGAYGEIRGGNGAGKTTLLRAIAGYLPPRAGAIRFEEVAEPALAVHYVGHLNGLKGASTPSDHVRYWAGLFGGAADDVLDRVGLSRQSDLPARVLSQGQARRLALARLLVAPRPIWLLDEPAAGLDAEGRAVLTDLVQTHCASGGVALAAVHDALGPMPAFSLKIGA
jgi:heme exporter protein A